MLMCLTQPREAGQTPSCEFSSLCASSYLFPLRDRPGRALDNVASKMIQSGSLTPEQNEFSAHLKFSPPENALRDAEFLDVSLLVVQRQWHNTRDVHFRTKDMHIQAQLFANTLDVP